MSSLPPSGPLRAILVLIAAIAVAVPAAVVRFAPSVPHHRSPTGLRPKVVPPTVVPPVEPVEFVDLPPDEARIFNADVPFSTGPNPPARPFRSSDEPQDLARATDCLATAVLYEAGADPAGQRAVAQVVLNRARHPAFPKTICGVVFEGQERRTGCQFSFTCDGALTRWSPPEVLWIAARKVAAAALAGAVYRPVGYATHYHTDWVVPYWQSSLDKIAKVGTHLFFRWSGWWGTPRAFDRRVAIGEPIIGKIAAISEAHRSGAMPDDGGVALAELADPGHGGVPQPLADDPNSFLVTLPAGLGPDAWPALAADACGTRLQCRFSAWSAPARTPATLPLSADQVGAMTFSYIRDRASGLERTLWNCREVRRASPRECMRQQVLLTAVPIPSQAPPSASTGSPAARGPAPLDGVRRVAVPPAARLPVPPSTRAIPVPQPSATPRPTRTPAPAGN